MRSTRVYIAGPYTLGNTGENVARAMRTWHTLFDAGYSPFCPHLTHFLHLLKPRSYEDWLDYDMDWVAVCDALLRLDGESAGADQEVVTMEARGRSVFTKVEELIRNLPATQED